MEIATLDNPRRMTRAYKGEPFEVSSTGTYHDNAGLARNYERVVIYFEPVTVRGPVRHRPKLRIVSKGYVSQGWVIGVIKGDQ